MMRLWRLIRRLLPGRPRLEAEGPQVGWVRVLPDDDWHAVCHGSNWEELHATLRLLNGPREGCLVSSLVLPAGTRPFTDLPPESLVEIAD
jgi:hypothetical protein